MAYEIPGQMVTAPAGSTALAAAQYRFVTLDATGKAILPGGSGGASVFGVLQNKPANGEAASVMINGLSKVKAVTGTLKAGDLVAASSVGYAEAPGAGDYVVGRVVAGSSGGTGRVLTVSIEPIGTT